MLFLCWLRFSIVKCRSCSSLSCDILHRGRKLQHESRKRCNISVFGGKVHDKIIFSSDISWVLKACCVIWIPLELPEMKLFTFHTTLLYLPCNSCQIRYFNTPTFSENLDMKVGLSWEAPNSNKFKWTFASGKRGGRGANWFGVGYKVMKSIVFMVFCEALHCIENVNIWSG